MTGVRFSETNRVDTIYKLPLKLSELRCDGRFVQTLRRVPTRKENQEKKKLMAYLEPEGTHVRVPG